MYGQEIHRFCPVCKPEILEDSHWVAVRCPQHYLGPVIPGLDPETLKQVPDTVQKTLRALWEAGITPEEAYEAVSHLDFSRRKV